MPTRDARLANILLAAYAALSLLALSLPVGPWVLAAKRLAAYLVLPGAESGTAGLEAMGGVSTRWSALLRADVENRDLRAKLEQAAVESAEARAAAEENRRLREALQFKPRAGLRLVPARVIARDPASWYSSVTVDKGETGGVRTGAAAFALVDGRLALVGRVAEAAGDSARVLLVTDGLSSVAATVSPGGWDGLVDGQGSRRLVMNFIPADALPRVGDPVLTSPVSRTFPPQVLIGTLSRILESDPYLAYRTAEVQAAAEPTSLRLLLVQEVP